jgi:hypothetical protein
MLMLASQIVALMQAVLVAVELRRLARDFEWLEDQVAELRRSVSKRPAAPAQSGWRQPAQQSASGLGRPSTPASEEPRPSLASALGRPSAFS